VDYAIVAVVSYLLGSIPTGLLVGKALGGIDIRRYGSGNIGATNTLRVLGPKASAIVLMADFVKGALPVIVVSLLFGDELHKILAALGALTGHNWSIFMGLKGGRGVATGIGGLVIMSPLLFAVNVGSGLAVIVASRYVSLGSIVGAAVIIFMGILMFAVGNVSSQFFIYVVIGGSMVLFKHRDNLARLLKGKERKLGEHVQAS